MALSKKQKDQALLGLLVFGGLVWFVPSKVIKPVNEKIAKFQEELTEVEDKVKTMKRQANRLPALQKEHDSLEAEVGKAEKKLPRQKNTEEILRVVTEQSIKQKVSVKSFAPQTEVSRNYFLEIPFRLSILGSFHTVGEFLTILGQQERILSARNLTLTYSLNVDQGYTVSGSFVLLAYMFKG